MLLNDPGPRNHKWYRTTMRTEVPDTAIAAFRSFSEALMEPFFCRAHDTQQGSFVRGQADRLLAGMKAASLLAT